MGVGFRSRRLRRRVAPRLQFGTGRRSPSCYRPVAHHSMDAAIDDRRASDARGRDGSVSTGGPRRIQLRIAVVGTATLALLAISASVVTLSPTPKTSSMASGAAPTVGPT